MPSDAARRSRPHRKRQLIRSASPSRRSRRSRGRRTWPERRARGRRSTSRPSTSARTRTRRSIATSVHRGVSPRVKGPCVVPGIHRAAVALWRARVGVRRGGWGTGGHKHGNGHDREDSHRVHAIEHIRRLSASFDDFSTPVESRLKKRRGAHLTTRYPTNPARASKPMVGCSTHPGRASIF
jgi:hypothetical protein